MMDASLVDNGTTFSLCPRTERARVWVAENLQFEAWQWLGNRLALDWRFARDVRDRMEADGLAVNRREAAHA